MVFQDDTVNLYTYATMRMSPRALSSSSRSWSYLYRGSTAAHLTTGSVLPTSSSSSEHIHRSRDTSPSGDDRYVIVRPLQQDKWSKGKDGFLVTERWSSDAQTLNSSIPTIWLKQTEEMMYLCAHQHKNVTIILLIPVTFINSVERDIPIVKQQFLENVSILSASLLDAFVAILHLMQTQRTEHHLDELLA